MFEGASQLLSTALFKAKALAAGITEIELKVLEATNEDKWGPHGNDMKEIAREAQDPEKRMLIMGAIWQRLQESEENWRLCYKALLLCDFLVKQGPKRCVEELQRSVYVIERLRDNFHYKDPNGVDHGINVRKRAGDLATLLFNNDKIIEEREKARINAGKYTGVSASDMMRGGGGGSYGGFGSNTVGSGYHSGGGGDGGSYSGGGGYSSRETAPRYGSTGHTRGGADGGLYDSTRSGSGNGSSRADDAVEDPFEATRRRIERLKAQEAARREAEAKEQVPDDGTGGGHVPKGSINMDGPASLFPEAKARAGPKRLSEVKVDPAIAAAFGGAGIAGPPPSGSKVKSSTPAAAVPPPPAAAATTRIAASAATTDFFADAPSSVPPAQTAGQSSQQKVGAAGLNWDALSFDDAGSGSRPAAAPKPVATPPAPQNLLDDLLGSPVVSTAAAPSVQTAAFDAFGTAAPAAAAAKAPLTSIDPFAILSTPPAPATALHAQPAVAAVALPTKPSFSAHSSGGGSKDPFSGIGFPAASGPSQPMKSTTAGSAAVLHSATPAVVGSTLDHFSNFAAAPSAAASAVHSSGGGAFDPFAPVGLGVAKPAASAAARVSDGDDFGSFAAATPAPAAGGKVVGAVGGVFGLPPPPSNAPMNPAAAAKLPLKKSADPFADLL